MMLLLRCACGVRRGALLGRPWSRLPLGELLGTRNGLVVPDTMNEVTRSPIGGQNAPDVGKPQPSKADTEGGREPSEDQGPAGASHLADPADDRCTDGRPPDEDHY